MSTDFICNERSSFPVPQSHDIHCHSSQDYSREITDLAPLQRSKPKIPIDELLEATKPIKPFPWDKETDMSVGGALADYLDNLFDKFFSILN